MKILCAVADFSPEARPVLDALGEVDYVQLTQEELEARISEYDALFVRIGLSVNDTVLKNGANLRAVATATTGLNHLDLISAKDRGIEVLSLRGENEFLNTITSTAELAFGLLIDLYRYNPWAFASIQRHELHLEEFRGRSLSGKTLGILGMGRLGRIVARGAAGWGMRIIFCDPNVSPEEFPQYTKVDFETLLKESDAISIHVHLKDDTQGLFTKEVLQKMKPSAVLINTSRGEIVDEAAVLRALEAGTLGGYATDVLAHELDLLKEFKNHPLVEYAKVHQNCIIVPHTGGLTHDSRIGTDVFMAKKLSAYLATH